MKKSKRVLKVIRQKTAIKLRMNLIFKPLILAASGKLRIMVDIYTENKNGDVTAAVLSDPRSSTPTLKQEEAPWEKPDLDGNELASALALSQAIHLILSS